MSVDDPNAEGEGSAGWLTGLTEAGLGQIALGKPASRAISRLIAGVAEVPSEALAWVSEMIRDDRAARHQFKMALAAAAAKAVKQDKAILDAAVRRLAGRDARTANRVAVIANALEYLADEPPAATSDDSPTDDFLNVFEELSGRASSEAMQDLFARVLSGEIRRPGSFSLRTLQVVAVMDQDLARVFNQVREWVVNNDFVPFVPPLTTGEKLSRISELEDMSVLRLARSRDLPVDPTGATGLRFFDAAILLKFAPGGIITLPIAQLTRVGKEVMSIIPRSGDKATVSAIASGIKSLMPNLRVGFAPITKQTERGFEIGEVKDVES